MKLKYYLIASPENHYQPWILSKTAMACFIISLWALRLFLPSYIAISAPGLDAQDLMNRINQERTQRLLPALVMNSKLMSAAEIKSQDMIDRDYFAHVNPDGDYVWPVIEEQGYKPYKALGENLAIDFTSAESIVKAWMNSPGHRANILNEKFEDQGMAALYGEFEGNRNTYLVTNLFGSLLKKTNPNPPPAPVAANPKDTSDETTPVVSGSETSDTPKADSAPIPAQADTSSGPIEPDIPLTVPPDQTDSLVTSLPVANTSSSPGLVSMKVLVGGFAGAYTLLLALDSFIVHRARVQRQTIAASPHSLMLVLIALVNFLTLWI